MIIYMDVSVKRHVYFRPMAHIPLCTYTHPDLFLQCLLPSSSTVTVRYDRKNDNLQNYNVLTTAPEINM